MVIIDDWNCFEILLIRFKLINFISILVFFWVIWFGVRDLYSCEYICKCI